MRQLAPFRSGPWLLTAVLVASSALPIQGATAELVADLNTQRENRQASSVFELTALARGRLAFLSGESGSGFEVWVSDGTAQGTRLAVDVCPGPCSPQADIVGTANGIAFWTTWPAERPPEIWRTDGTREGTFPLSAADVPLEAFPVRACVHGSCIPIHQEYPSVDGALLFPACHSVQGCGMWRSDGTRGGTVLVKAFSDSETRSWPMTASEGSAFFVVPHQGGPALWRTDGTEAGTFRLHDFESGVAALAASGGHLFLLVMTLENLDLWVSDGSPGGARSLARFSDYRYGSFVFHAANGRAYFFVDDEADGREIWRSDGTVAGTRRITELADPGALRATTDLEEVDGRLVFRARTEEGGDSLWTTDGRPESTTLLASRIGYQPMVKVAGRVLFTTEEEADDLALWSTDGTAAGTRLVRDFCPGTCDYEVAGLSLLRGKAIFTAQAGENAPRQLWESDGTPGGTRPLTWFEASGVDAAEPFSVAAVVGDEIFFPASSPSRGVELWATNGRRQRRVADIDRSEPSSNPRFLTAAGGPLFFEASDGESTGLWHSAPGEAPARFHEGTIFYGGCIGCPRGDIGVGRLLFFVTELYGQVWRSDGTEAGTFPLTRLETPHLIALPLVEHQGRVWFRVESQDKVDLWQTDGTVAGTERVLELPRGGLDGLSSTGAELYFGLDTSGEIWKSDGTPLGTSKVFDLPNQDSLTSHFVRAGGSVFFVTWAAGSSWLWSTDGTEAGTQRLAGWQGFGIAEMVETGGVLYFFASDFEGPSGLWRSDGSPAGTRLVKELTVRRYPNGEQIVPSGLTPFGGRLFFAAEGPEGIELWASDGTADGTGLVRDLSPDGSSHPGEFTIAGDRLFFTAHDGTHGFELWESDGTPEGTRMVQDLMPGPSSSLPAQLTATGDRLYFVADDGVVGRELWALPLTGPDGCRPSPTRLCLMDGRFQVEVVWHDFLGRTGTGQAAAMTGDTGAFWFFDSANIELVVKVLDGRSLNDHFWTFYGALSSVEYLVTVTDTRTGLTRQYLNLPGQLASVGDTTSFGPRAAYASKNPVTHPSPPPGITKRTGRAAATGSCQPSATRLCLRDGRFAVEASWKDFQGKTGQGTAVNLSGDTGYFWFFDAANVEVVLKVLDGTPVNGKHWVFYGALSNVEYTLTVTDTQTGKVKAYKNPSGRFASAADTAAF